MLTSEDIVNVFVGFSHPHCQKRLPILDAIEEKLISSASHNELKIEECTEILFEMAQL